MSTEDSPYVFRASQTALRTHSDTLKVKEARMTDGMIVRYQERTAGGADGPDHPWCETGHSAYILSGRLRYEFADHEVEVGPGDIVHIPAGYPHRHRPYAIGEEPVRYFITEFS